MLGALNGKDIPASGEQLVLIRPGAAPEALSVPGGIGEDASYGYTVAGRGPVGLIIDPNRSGKSHLFDSATNRIVSAAGLNVEECPIVSADGDRVAYATTGGAVNVVTISSGEVVEIAPAGRPVSFGAAGEYVLIDAEGTLRVAADGSGRAEASVQRAPVSLQSYRYCRIGHTGQALVFTGYGLVVYNVAKDSSYAVPAFPVPDSCAMSQDGRWFVAGPVLIDTQKQDSWFLPAIGIPNGQPELVDELATARVADYRFADRQPPIPGVEAR